MYTVQVLRDQLGIQCILGLTATATQSTVKNISQLLDIKSDSVIVGSSLPDNLEISVSCVTNREQVSHVNLQVHTHKTYLIQFKFVVVKYM